MRFYRLLLHLYPSTFSRDYEDDWCFPKESLNTFQQIHHIKALTAVQVVYQNNYPSGVELSD